MWYLVGSKTRTVKEDSKGKPNKFRKKTQHLIRVAVYLKLILKKILQKKVWYLMFKS